MFQGLLGVFLASGPCKSPGGHVGMPCSANEPFECIGGKWRRRNKKLWIVSKS